MRNKLGTLIAAVVILLGLSSAKVAFSAFAPGNVIVGVGDGWINEYTPTGVYVASYDTTHRGTETDGLAFDSSGNLYSTNGFGTVTPFVSKFDPSGARIGDFGSGYEAHPESIAFRPNGDVLIGQATGGTPFLKEFTSSGAFVRNYAPAVEARGTDWIDLKADGNTLYYTSEGHLVKTYDLASDTQGPNFASGLPGSNAYALRIIPDGSGRVLVADTDRIVLLNAAGMVTNTYLLGADSLLFALNLDPDGVSFWTLGYFSHHIWEVNIATGAIEESWVVGGPHVSAITSGLALNGELCESCGQVPEPATLSLLGLGLAGLIARRKVKKS